MINANTEDNAQNLDGNLNENLDEGSEKVSDAIDDKKGSKKNDAKEKVQDIIVNANEVLLHKHIRILCDEPLPHLDKGLVKAYRGIGKDKFSSNLCVFLCHKSLTPRRIASIKYQKIVNPNLVKLEHSGKVTWPKTKDEYFCLAFANALSIPVLAKKDKSPALGWNADEVLENVVYPMLDVFEDLHNKDLIHGEIWPGNMFHNGTGAKEKVDLGECLTAPVSSQLPALYEPIERALADAIGRGMGTLADDLYAFGVSLAVILRSSDPMKGKNDEEIIEKKIEKGSYITLLGTHRLRGAMLELLRGLLYDDPVQRWDLEDIHAWREGRRLSPKQSPKRVKATRPIIMGRKKYIRPEIFAKDMWEHVDDVAKLVDNKEIGQWIDRAIEDKSLKGRLEQAMQDISSYERGSGYNNRVCVSLSTTLYTECPIRYKGLSFIPYGFGAALSNAYVMKKDLQPYVDVLRHIFVMQSIRLRKNTDVSALVARFDSCRAFIGQTDVSSGLERCIYFMDPESVCLSPILEKYYVHTPEEIMEAFESLCASSRPSILFDRHVISFLSIKDRKNIDPYLLDLKAKESYRRSLGQIRTLATIQKRSALGKFPAITEWFSRNLEDLYNHFHDDEKKKKFKKKVDTLKRSGDLSRLALLFDDPNLYHNDVNSFFQAMEEYRRIDQEKILIEERLNSKKNYGQRSGRQIASVISMILSVIVMAASAYLKFF